MNLIEYKKIIQENLEKYFKEYKKDSLYSSKIWDSMSYTTLLDGKRLRAIMCLETAKSFGVEIQKAMPLAAAMEIMHAYSLIHDDLPCMDNDDLRRGKPTNHKVFGEAIAVLAGDALISFGAQLIIDKLDAPSDVKLSIVNDYLKTAGALGIVAGQVADIEAENKKIEIDNLKYIHKFKTGALFKCSMVIGAKLAQVKEETLRAIEKYADNFGILFQVYDDIIDCTLSTDELGKTAGKDADVNKLTYVKAFGLQEAKNIYNSLKLENYDILTKLNIKLNVFDEIYQLLDKRIN
ncbi:MAG: polyprenyl synthetase family protein [Candidatus Gastranaerophilales bacterium]|nr:polyprenyl synthetase family protein [Candidatus Gastranaerophilales bacterium]